MNKELSEFYKKIAKRELGETESKKDQSIKQFREWLGKHPYLKFHNIDDFEILKFLRHRKYQMSKVFESFEKIMINTKIYIHFLKHSDEIITRLLTIYNSGVINILKKHDKDGSKVVFINAKLFEEVGMTTDEMIRFSYICGSAGSLDEEIQIAGVKVIYDCRGVTLKMFKKVPFKFLFKNASLSSHVPLRLKKLFLIGFPNFAVEFMNVILPFIPKKFFERTKFLNDESELFEYFDKSLLLEEYGGNFKKFDCVEEHREIYIKSIEHSNALVEKIEIDFEKYEKFGGHFDKIESFRNLDFD